MWGLLGLHHLRGAQLPSSLQEERNLLIAITEAPDLDSLHPDGALTIAEMRKHSTPDTRMTNENKTSLSSLGGALRSTADPLCGVAASVFPSERGEEMSGFDYLEGDSSCDRLPSWPVEEELSLWFHRTLQPLLLGSSEGEKTLCRCEWRAAP